MKRVRMYNMRFCLMLIVLVLLVASNIRAGEVASGSDAVPYSAISWFLSVVLLGSFGWWAKDVKIRCRPN
jgi:cell shape-determining protein MreC